jgi:2-haloacid dehalogenase
MSAIKAVVFDIGNVLIGWQPEQFYDRMIGPERRVQLFAQVDIDGMNASVDLGADLALAVRAKAAQHPEWHDEIHLWHDRWIDMAQPAIGHSVKLLRSLRRRGVPVFALSNFGIATLEAANAVYPFLREFDRQYISGHMGVVKPDPEIYRRLEDDSGVAPASLLFTDDRSENIDAAAQRGWRVHLFENAQGFADRLVAEALLNTEEATP